jgi:hypothetical protein
MPIVLCLRAESVTPRKSSSVPRGWSGKTDYGSSVFRLRKFKRSMRLIV